MNNDKLFWKENADERKKKHTQITQQWQQKSDDDIRNSNDK